MNHKINKHNNPSQLGPWNLSQTNKPPQPELKIPQNLIAFTNNHASPRLTIRFPRISQQMQHTSISKKLSLKMSHQSLQLKQYDHPTKEKAKRYGALNGSFLHTHNDKDRKARNKIGFVFEERNNLNRRVSTIIIEPLQSQEGQKREAKNHCLLNAQSSKKRSLYSLIGQLKSSNQLMQLYLLQRAKH